MTYSYSILCNGHVHHLQLSSALCVPVANVQWGGSNKPPLYRPTTPVTCNPYVICVVTQYFTSCGRMENTRDCMSGYCKQNKKENERIGNIEDKMEKK